MDPSPLADPATLAIVGLLVFAGFGVQAMAGFGGTIIPLTLGAHLLPIPELLALLVPLNLLQTVTVTLRERQHVRWRLLLKAVLPLMAIGGAGGVALALWLEGPLLRRLFGALVVVFALRELVRLRGSQEGEAPAPLPKPLAGAFLLAAGVTHGIYASGGALLVYVVGRLGLDKAAFRATLMTVWLVLGVGLCGVYLVDGRLGQPQLIGIGLLIPALVLALFAGYWAHARVDERRFRAVVWTLLLLAGGGLLP